METAAWKAGVATEHITPQQPMWLAGWAARRKPAHGTVMELFAKAFALEDHRGERALIITADLLAIPGPLAAAVANRLQMECNLSRERVLFNASHTHTAPELRPDKVPFFEIPPEFAARIEPYLNELEERLTAAGARALANLQPANLSLHQAQVGFAHNRRAGGGSIDPEVPILHVTGPTGRPLAILCGLACHNLTLPPTFCQYHGDYAGEALQRLEAAFPGTTALFLAGAGADQDPEPRGSLELALEHGRGLAQAIEYGLAKPGCAVRGELRTAFEEVPLDFLPLPARKVLEAEARSEDRPRSRKAQWLLAALAKGQSFPTHYRCPVQVLRLGEELLLIALGGEPVVDYALNFKAAFANRRVWVAGYSNDMFGYLPTQRIQQEGGYEGARSLYWSALPMPFTDTVEERITTAVRRLVAKTER